MATAMFLVVGLASCGYSARRLAPSIEGVQPKERSLRVFVPVVENQAARTGVEAILTSALRSEFQRRVGVELVSDVSRADVMLFARVLRWGRTRGAAPVTGTAETESDGGIARNQSLAADSVVDLQLEARLVDRSSVPGVHRTIWMRTYESNSTVELSRRFSEQDGASSGPHINASRERLALESMSQDLARQVVAQVTQEF